MLGWESSGQPRDLPPSQNRTWSVTPSGSQFESSTRVGIQVVPDTD
jgi:hypothetical protein